MANAILHTAPSAQSAIVSGVTVNAGAGLLSSEYNNETNRHREASLELSFQHGSAPAGNWLIYVLYAMDGTNYEDGGSATQPGKLPTRIIPARAVTTAQRVTVAVDLKPFKMKILVWNDTDQNSSASSVTLDMEVYSPEVQ